MANVIEPAKDFPFRDLCNLLELLYQKKTKLEEKEDILIKFILEYRCKAALVTANNKNVSFYPILRLLVPTYDRERGSYNMKESKLGDLLVRVLRLNKQSLDAQKLLNRSCNNKDGDFGTVAYTVLKNRVMQKICNITVGDINDFLDVIAAAEIGNKRQILDALFTKVLKNMNADQIKWFLRIILKNLKLDKMSADRILLCYHPDAVEYHKTSSNLIKLCEAFEDGNVRPVEVGIELFCPVRPMKSARLNIRDISNLPQVRTYHIEEKFDGERFMIHMETRASAENPDRRIHVFEYFSNNGFRFTDVYGQTYDSGLLTPHLKDCFGSHVNSFVIDGEMMGWNKFTQKYGSKAMAFDVKKLTPHHGYQPCFVAFDIVYFNGKSLAGPPHRGGLRLCDRLPLLDKLFKDVKGSIHHSIRGNVTQNKDILDALNNAIDLEKEGIVIKDTDSWYIADNRNAGWYKTKPEYTDSAITDLDLVIIGADAAENSKHGAKSFLVAVADDTTKPPSRWLCIARVAPKLKRADHDELCAKLARCWQPSAVTPPPADLVFNKIKPDYWIKPIHSVVLEVRATELVKCKDFATPYTLRFARVKHIRADKRVEDTMTVDELNKFIADATKETPQSVIKMSTKRIGEDMISNVAKARKKRTTPVEVSASMQINVGDVEVVSKALEGRKIHIMTDDEDCKRDELAKIVMSHSGKPVANPGPDTWCIIVGRITHNARVLISTGTMDIAPSSWLRALPPSRQHYRLTPLDLYSMKTDTKLLCAKHYDAYGDSYQESIKEDTLKRCFKKIEESEPEIYLSKIEMMDLDQELFGNNNPYSYFRPYTLYVHRDRSILGIRSKMFGATLASASYRFLTHAVLPNDLDPATVLQIKQTVVKGAHVVSEDWLEKCFVDERAVDVTPYRM